MFTRLHDEFAGLFGRQTLDIEQVVDGLLSEIFASAHTPTG
jgi:hypothetical protein